MNNLSEIKQLPQLVTDKQHPSTDKRLGITPSLTGLLGWFKPITMAQPGGAA